MAYPQYMRAAKNRARLPAFIVRMRLKETA